jgi:hypothetical protein
MVVRLKTCCLHSSYAEMFCIQDLCCWLVAYSYRSDCSHAAQQQCIQRHCSHAAQQQWIQRHGGCGLPRRMFDCSAHNVLQHAKQLGL